MYFLLLSPSFIFDFVLQCFLTFMNCWIKLTCTKYYTPICWFRSMFDHFINISHITSIICRLANKGGMSERGYYQPHWKKWNWVQLSVRQFHKKCSRGIWIIEKDPSIQRSKHKIFGGVGRFKTDYPSPWSWIFA